ncbi:MAG: response regulator [Burkholderiaceae bacterium]
MNILVVDDTEFNRKLPATILRQLGHAVSEASDGPQALETLAADASIGHVLLDVNMPGMSGIEVCEAVRATPRGAKLRIIAFTAHAFPDDARKIMAAGFDAMLIKPITRATLLGALDLA